MATAPQVIEPKSTFEALITASQQIHAYAIENAEKYHRENALDDSPPPIDTFFRDEARKAFEVSAKINALILEVL